MPNSHLEQWQQKSEKKSFFWCSCYLLIIQITSFQVLLGRLIWHPKQSTRNASKKQTTFIQYKGQCQMWQGVGTLIHAISNFSMEQVFISSAFTLLYECRTELFNAETFFLIPSASSVIELSVQWYWTSSC